MILQIIWWRVIGNVLSNISPSTTFPTVLFLERSNQNCQAAFGGSEHYWVRGLRKRLCTKWHAALQPADSGPAQKTLACLWHLSQDSGPGSGTAGTETQVNILRGNVVGFHGNLDHMLPCCRGNGFWGCGSVPTVVGRPGNFHEEFFNRSACYLVLATWLT